MSIVGLIVYQARQPEGATVYPPKLKLKDASHEQIRGYSTNHIIIFHRNTQYHQYIYIYYVYMDATVGI